MILSKNDFVGDESRYIQFAENLVKGYYANPDLKPGFLWNGPGYPIVLSPLVFLKAPVFLPRLLNSFILFISILFFYKILLQFFNSTISVLLSYFTALSHPFFINAISQTLTEALATFLIISSIYFLIKHLNKGKSKDLILFTFFSGYLILTKVIFAYVFLTFLILILVISIFKKQYIFYIKYLVAPYLICLPYLFYTYSITNQFFYWSDAGGSSLYCMSTPIEEEYGDWFPTQYETFFESQRTYHYPFFKSLENIKENGIEYDKKLKSKAIENIINHPFKFFKNYLNNLNRTFTNSPKSKIRSSTLSIFHFPNNIYFSFILMLYFISVLNNIFRKKKIILVLSIFTLIYILGVSTLSSLQRFLFPIYPIVILIIFEFITNDFKQILNNINFKN